MKRRVYNVVVDENGQPIARALVKIQLNTPTFVSAETKEVAAWGIEVLTDANGRWEVELEANDTMSDPNSYYRIVEHSRKGAVVNEYLIRVPSTGFAEPIWIVNLLITQPEVTPPAEAVLSIAADNNTPLQGDIKLLSGTGIELQQDNNAKTITIVNIGGGGGGGGSHNLLSDTHPDTQVTTVSRGMLIVGRLVAGIVKWAGLVLGAAGKFLKSDGTDVVWSDVTWNDVQNKPSTFPPSPHQHVKADITDFAHTHPLSELQQSGATTGQVPKWSGTQWQAGNVDWNEVTNKPSTFPPSSHTHPRSDITDFFSTPFWNNIPDRPSTFPPEPHTHNAADIVSGRLSASRLPTSATANRFLVVRNANSDPTYDAIQASDLPSHTHTRSQITDFAHASTHQAGGSDEITGNLNANARVTVKNNGTVVGTRRAINFIAGTNVTLNISDDAANEEVDVTINAAGGGSSQHNLLDGVVHPDTSTTTVARGMLIVGQLVSGVVKWAGLALGAAGKFLKSDGTDVQWANITKADITDFAHTHTKSDITDFAHTHPPSDITPQGSGSGLDADTVDGVHAENLRIATIGLTVGDGVNAITTGFKGAIYIPFAGTITEWTILSTDGNPPTSGSIEIDILKSTYANYPTMSSIVGTGTKPNIANSTKGQGSPTGWATTAVNAGDCVGFNVTSVSSLKRITIVLKVVKS